MMLRRGTTLPDFLEGAARAHPRKRALSFGERAWTFLELHRAVGSAARDFGAHPGMAGGRIGILSGNRPGVPIAALAAARAGVPVVPLNWRLATEELAWQIEQAGISRLLVDEEHWRAAESAVRGKKVIVCPIEPLEHPAPDSNPVEPAPPIDLDREAIVIFTSGTSGRPKGARLSLGNIWFSATASALNLGHHESDVWLAAMPLFHIGGLSIVFRGVIGATPVVLHDRFAAGRVLGAIDAGATLVSLVPAMLRRLIDERGTRSWPASLRAVLLGGGPAPVDLVRESVASGIPIAPTYGLTEAASQVTTLHPAAAQDHVGSSGLPLPSTRVRIVEDGMARPAGSPGEIEIQGPTVFQGYLGEPEGSGNSEGWFSTGDAGYLDEDGYLYVIDRRGDLMISGGENVYPAEIERVLLSHPEVLDAGVVGMSDSRWGARPVAVVVWTGAPDEAEPVLLAFCRERLASYKVPVRVIVASEVPRSPSGKLLRRVLRSMVAPEIGTDND